MIYDPTILVECDYCKDTIEVTPTYVYSTVDGQGGHYDTSDGALEHLIEEHGWMIYEDDCVFCCEDCEKAFGEA